MTDRAPSEYGPEFDPPGCSADQHLTREMVQAVASGWYKGLPEGATRRFRKGVMDGLVNDIFGKEMPCPRCWKRHGPRECEAPDA